MFDFLKQLGFFGLLFFLSFGVVSFRAPDSIGSVVLDEVVLPGSFELGSGFYSGQYYYVAVGVVASGTVFERLPFGVAPNKRVVF